MSEKNPQFRLVKITPEIAAEYLETMVENQRKLSPRRVNTMAKAIERGEWLFDGNAIKFNKNGQLIDGQHRLAAVIQCGIPVETLVITDMDPDTIKVIDSGRSRTVSDVLKMEGITDYHNTASIVNSLIRLESGTYQPRGWSENWFDPTPQMVLARYKQDPQAIEEARAMGHKMANTTGTIVSAGALWYHEARQIDQEDADHFAHQLTSGENLSDGDPALTLRRLVNRKNQNRPKRNFVHYALLAKSWNYYRDGKSVKLLMFRPGGKQRENIPEMR